MLLVTGPCGSGKLTTIKVLAGEYGFDIFEYAAPIEIMSQDDENPENLEYMPKRLQVEHLIKFLRETSRFGSILMQAPKKKLLVVKDFPNVFMDSPKMFEDVLLWVPFRDIF